MKYSFFTFLLLLSFYNVSAFSDTTDIPLNRRSRHDDIRKEQIKCDKLDGKLDGVLRAGNNDMVNSLVTDALFRKPNEFRYQIETNNKAYPNNNEKIRYLRYVTQMLFYYRIGVRAKELAISELPALLSCSEKIMKARAEGESIIPFLEESSYQVAKINAQVFSDSVDRYEASATVYLKYARLHPDRILQTITPFVNEHYADSLIVLACHRNPLQFYSYAQAQETPLGKLIHRSTDNMVMQVAQLSQTDNALFYFPFLDDILSGRQPMDSIKKYVGNGEKGYDSIGYFKLLTKTATAYSRRMAAPLRDTPVAYYGANRLWQTLHSKALQHFITPINELHDISNLTIRMKAIQKLSASDLYYMIVTGENDIYTSSYKHSFNRMMQLMGNKPKGDSLLLSVNFDKFRKFIKMAANYNKLDTFLKTMPPLRSEELMKAFVAKLDNNNLEDAVDVADSYSSIADKKLQLSMLENIMLNESGANAENNRDGMAIYGLLKAIFLSLDEKNHIDLSAQIGIPPVYEVANKYMQNDSGRIIEQIFFYGDKDGKAYFPSFRNSFLPKAWKVKETKEWIEAVSVTGNVIVFANKPLDNDANLDDSAQIHLASYLEERGLKPAVIVHRGHSYWLSRTMSRMPGDAKIVVLGSCGGFQNLNTILEINPDAHIISTKEIGTGDINGPILTYMNTVFTSGKDLSWPVMWQALTKKFSTDKSKAVRDSWDDYIPPYKNLGAIFLKAYTKKLENE